MLVYQKSETEAYSEPYQALGRAICKIVNSYTVVGFTNQNYICNYQRFTLSTFLSCNFFFHYGLVKLI